MDIINKYEKWFIEFFGKTGVDGFEAAGCLFGCPQLESVNCFSKGPCQIKKCKCGMVWNANQPTQRTLDKFYTESEAMRVWSTYKESEHEMLRQKEKFSAGIKTVLATGARTVLDIGAGNGVFLNCLKEQDRSIKAFGIDPSPSAVMKAKTYGVDVRNMELKAWSTVNSPVDMCTLWGVLEHLKEPLETLKLIHQISSHILICVPNVNSTVVKTLGRRAFTFCPQHLWYFNTTTLKRLLGKSGFRFRSAFTIEDEVEPIQKARSLIDDPYRKDTPDWAWKDERLEYPVEGYKIVMIGERIDGADGMRCSIA